MQKILDGLNEWREVRGLQNEAGNIAANLTEEVLEHMRATNDEERVDALCDLFVFSVNGIKALGGCDKWICKYKYKHATAKNTPVIAAPILSQIAGFVDSHGLNTRRLEQVIENSLLGLHGMGYDPILCLQETIKEISSRTGEHDPLINKWVKYKTPEAMALWYKADYSKCKVK